MIKCLNYWKWVKIITVISDYYFFWRILVTKRQPLISFMILLFADWTFFPLSRLEFYFSVCNSHLEHKLLLYHCKLKLKDFKQASSFIAKTKGIGKFDIFLLTFWKDLKWLLIGLAKISKKIPWIQLCLFHIGRKSLGFLLSSL